MKYMTVRDDGCILIKDVRLSYPHVFEPFGKEETRTDGSKKEKKYSTKIMMPLATHKAEIVALRNHAIAAWKEAFKSSPPDDRLFVYKGAGTGKDHYEGHWIVSASESTKPTVVDRQKRPITEKEGLIYGGVFANVLLRPWVQNHKEGGKRINANLLMVQYFREGEALDEGAGARPPVDDVFEEFEDEEGSISGAADLDDDLDL